MIRLPARLFLCRDEGGVKRWDTAKNGGPFFAYGLGNAISFPITVVAPTDIGKEIALPRP